MDRKSINIKRSAYREKFLTKSFTIREILKWKYNYFENVPHEHRDFYAFLREFRVYSNTREFRKLWRLRMDDLFYAEAKEKISKIIELAMLNEKNEDEAPVFDPARLLQNYDNEVLSMIRRVREEFIGYLKYPKSYPNFEEEKRSFIIQRFNSYDNVGAFKLELEEKLFRRHWVNRLATLCDIQVIKEKRAIRENWKELIPSYYNKAEETAGSEELRGLLMSDQEGNE